MFSTSILRRGWPHLLALLLATVQYTLSVVTAGASRLSADTSRAGGAASASTGNSDPCNPGWSVVPSPNVAGYVNALQGAAAISANDVWAVGSDKYLGGDYQIESFILTTRNSQLTTNNSK